VKNLPVVFLAFLLIAGTWFAIYGKPASAKSETAAPAELMAVVSVQEPSATPMPTRTPNYSPTPDILANALGTKTALDVALGIAQNTAAAGAWTSTALVGESIGTRTQMAADGQETLDAGATDQAAAVIIAGATKTQQAAIVSTGTAVAQHALDIATTATIQAPINRRNEVIADWAPMWSGTIEVFLALVGLLICYRIILSINSKWREMTPDPGGEPQPVQIDEPIPMPIMVQETKTNGGFIQVDQYEFPPFITREELHNVAVAILESGAPFSRPALVDTKIITDKIWDALRWWMARRGYAKPVNPGQANSAWFITPAGTAFLEAFR
jgi:hypothetical protein